MKQALILGFLGQTQDRFSTYQPPADTAEKFAIAAKIRGLEALELVYPYEVSDPDTTRSLCHQHNLNIAAINVNIKKEPQFVPGSASRPVAQIRKEAVSYIHGAKDFAAATGAPLVTCCPLSDGYDQLFQVDYRAAWRHLVEVFSEAAAYRSEIPLFIEPKPSETRVHCHLDNTATALLLLKDIGIKQMGITLDFGHSLYAGENPARSLVAIVQAGFKPYIHTNDNDQRFDWDLIAGSRNFLHYAELFFYAREIGYDHYFTTDASPRTFDRIGYFERHIDFTRALDQRIGTINRNQWITWMREEKSLELMHAVQQDIYGLPTHYTPERL